MKVNYTNRHNEDQTFEVNERGNIQWKADFDFSSITSAKELKCITIVDPPGGPYINLGYDMGGIYKSFDGMIVKAFISNEDGYEIVTVVNEVVDNRSLLEREHPDFPKSQRKIVDFLPINRKEQTVSEKKVMDYLDENGNEDGE